MNTDALTDLVSNAAGALILIFMISVLQLTSGQDSDSADNEHMTRKKPVFVVIHGDRMVWLDLAQIFTRALQVPRNAQVEAVYELGDGLKGRFNQESVLALDITRPDALPKVDEPLDLNRSLTDKLDAIDPKTSFIFVFAYDRLDGKSFALFNKLKTVFHSRRIDVGWRPVSTDHPPVLCAVPWRPDCHYPISFNVDNPV